MREGRAISKFPSTFRLWEPEASHVSREVGRISRDAPRVSRDGKRLITTVWIHCEWRPSRHRSGFQPLYVSEPASLSTRRSVDSIRAPPFRLTFTVNVIISMHRVWTAQRSLRRVHHSHFPARESRVFYFLLVGRGGRESRPRGEIRKAVDQSPREKSGGKQTYIGGRWSPGPFWDVGFRGTTVKATVVGRDRRFMLDKPPFVSLLPLSSPFFPTAREPSHARKDISVALVGIDTYRQLPRRHRKLLPKPPKLLTLLGLLRVEQSFRQPT